LFHCAASCASLSPPGGPPPSPTALTSSRNDIAGAVSGVLCLLAKEWDFCLRDLVFATFFAKNHFVWRAHSHSMVWQTLGFDCCELCGAPLSAPCPCYAAADDADTMTEEEVPVEEAVAALNPVLEYASNCLSQQLGNPSPSGPHPRHEPVHLRVVRG
jgi:hypothetical protein